MKTIAARFCRLELYPCCLEQENSKLLFFKKLFKMPQSVALAGICFAFVDVSSVMLVFIIQ